MKIFLLLCLMWVAFQIISCSEASVENSKSVAVDNTNLSDSNILATVGNTPLSKSSHTSLENCIKKAGWLLPSSKDRYVSKTKAGKMSTEKGNEVEATQTTYGYNTSWFYSQDVPCRDDDLNFLRGKIETQWYIEFSVGGRVFMYSIFAKEVKVTPPSNSDPGEERFFYDIRDEDGDGVFETLVGGDQEKMVPTWVLK